MRDALRWVVAEAEKAGVGFADARAVEQTGASLQRQDGKTDRLSEHQSLGIGIRVLLEGAWGFACTNETGRDDLKRCLDTAVEMAKASQARIAEPGVLADVAPSVDEYVSPCETDPRTCGEEDVHRQRPGGGSEEPRRRQGR
jgi:TldD protein